jgi:Domain of unknown function (DUF3885)
MKPKIPRHSDTARRCRSPLPIFGLSSICSYQSRILTGQLRSPSKSITKQLSWGAGLQNGILSNLPSPVPWPTATYRKPDFSGNCSLTNPARSFKPRSNACRFARREHCYRFEMDFGDEFDLKSSLDRLFPGLSLGGDLFHQSPIGVRFNIGLAEIDRALLIFNAIFRDAEAIVLLDEDSSWEADPTRWYELFSLPGLLRSSEKPTVRSYEIKLSEDEIYTVRWAIIRSSVLSTGRLFEAIANQDHGRTPSVRGRVHIFDPGAEVLLHMYDDRGMDVIATSVAPLLTLKRSFSSWINREKLDGNDSAQR